MASIVRRFKPSGPPSRSKKLVGSEEHLRAQFQTLETRRDLADVLDIPYWQLDWLVRRSPVAARYREEHVPKRSGSPRRILVPAPALRIAQAKLLQLLDAAYTPRSSVHGFVRSRSSVTNARPHIRRAWVLNIDIYDFFPSINFGRVRGAFIKNPFGLPAPVATAIAQLCCHDNQLPQGAPTSPAISNIVCARLDANLVELAKQHRVTYTRFADDMTFSSTSAHVPAAIAVPSGSGASAQLGADLLAVLMNNGFKPNAAKTRLQRRTHRQEVTGVAVNTFPNVSRRYVRAIRAMLHAAEKFGVESASTTCRSRLSLPPETLLTPGHFMSVLRGRIAYVHMVRGKNDPLVRALWRRFQEIVAPGSRAILPKPAWHERVRQAMWILESEENCSQGTAFDLSGFGTITCAHVLAHDVRAHRASSVAVKEPVLVLYRSDARDLALIRIGSEPSHSGLELSTSEDPLIGDLVHVAGFPNYNIGDTGFYAPGRVAGIRSTSGIKHALVQGTIAAGMSGGPVLDSECERTIGMMVTGADSLSDPRHTEKHGFVPLRYLKEFLDEAMNARKEPSE